jgi:hypothetical protein
LKEDQKDSAAVQLSQAQTIRTLVDAGYEADTVVAAVLANDYSQLKHSGLFSVQLQPPADTAPAVQAGPPVLPGDAQPPALPPGSPNGKSTTPVPQGGA